MFTSDNEFNNNYIYSFKNNKFILSTLNFSNYIHITFLNKYNFNITLKDMTLCSLKDNNYSCNSIFSTDFNCLQTLNDKQINDSLVLFNNELRLQYNKDIEKIKQEYNNKINKLETKNNKLLNELSKKDKLNKRLVNILTIYKYHELNNVQKYNYEEIKEKNKKLNNEFKRVAKLMKLNR